MSKEKQPEQKREHSKLESDCKAFERMFERAWIVTILGVIACFYWIRPLQTDAPTWSRVVLTLLCIGYPFFLLIWVLKPLDHKIKLIQQSLGLDRAAKLRQETYYSWGSIFDLFLVIVMSAAFLLLACFGKDWQ